MVIGLQMFIFTFLNIGIGLQKVWIHCSIFNRLNCLQKDALCCQWNKTKVISETTALCNCIYILKSVSAPPQTCCNTGSNWLLIALISRWRHDEGHQLWSAHKWDVQGCTTLKSMHVYDAQVNRTKMLCAAGSDDIDGNYLKNVKIFKKKPKKQLIL